MEEARKVRMMLERNWIEAVILMVVLIISVAVKLLVHRKVEELDGLGEIHEKGDLDGEVVTRVQSDDKKVEKKGKGRWNSKALLVMLFAGFVLTLGTIHVAAENGRGSVIVYLQGHVELSGDRNTRDIQDDEFLFQLISESEDISLPGSTLGVTSGGEVYFGSFSFMGEGEYNFSVRQMDVGKDGYEYDFAVYSICVKVSGEEGDLQAQVTYRKNGNAVNQIVYHNRFTDIRVQEMENEVEAVEDVEEEVKKASVSTVRDHSHNSFGPGEEINTEFRVVNTGEDELDGVYIRMYVPEYALFLRCSQEGQYGAIEGREHVTWVVENLKPGEEVVAEITYRVNICLPDAYEVVEECYYEMIEDGEMPLVNDPMDPMVRVEDFVMEMY